MSEIQILLADDHPLIRQGLRGLLEAEAGLRVVGETGDGLEAVALAERLQPQVLVADLMMPGLSGLEVIRQVRERVPQVRTVVLSMHNSEGYVLEALRHGATAYVLKDAPGAELVQAVYAAAAGRRYLSDALSQRAFAVYAEKAEEAVADAYDALSTREREVLHLAAEGRSSAEIAARLFISPRTTETHRGSMMRKLGMRTQTDLIRYALRRGILPLDI